MAKLFSQIFGVNTAQFPNGISVDSVHLIFKAKDDFAPVTLRLHPVVNGLPVITSKIPYAEKTLTPMVVNLVNPANTTPNVSNTSHSTVFRFGTPIHLTPATWYAIVVDTPSNKYEVLTADVRAPAYGSERAITRPGFIRSFFRTQNTDQWVEDPNVMLTFKLQQSFYTSPKTLTYTVQPSTVANTYGALFQLNSHHVLPPKTAITYQYKARYVGDSVDTTARSVNLHENVVPANEIFVPMQSFGANANNAFNVTVQMSTSDPFVTPMLDPSRLNLTLVDYIINNGELSNNLILVSNGGLYANSNATCTPTVSISAPDDANGVQATAYATLAPRTEAGVTVNAVANIVFSNVGSGYYTTPNVTISFPGAGLCTTNAVANVVGETSRSGGNALARYITRKVTLEPGFDATDLRVWLTANRKKGQSIQVYYKVLSALDPNQNFDHRPWVRMVSTSNNSVVNSLTSDEYIEYTYQDVNSPAITYTSPLGYVYTDFRVFAIKITMYSNDPTSVPSVRDLRCIALA